ncbi:cation diffusion facilitator family transporter [Iamia sp.]|uniref:cation diffusion facilitator family transporter n=1 Tax=Iamia sp. TaxID=2722710 RepID=UPI002CB2CF95|nr:cation diffusion facilitator family transporter [Iamia sp.]HXH58516.1 cation diffusion facilitator family transporter [Iamia sp.]
MSGDHGHRHEPSLARSGAAHWNRLLVSFALVATFFVVEAVGGVLTNSLALLSDAGHMLTDVIGLGLALTAIRLATRHEARRPDAASRHTFGLYRLEILAAFVNALLLFGVAIYVLVEAARRVTDEPEVLAAPMLVVAVLGLVVNLVAFMLLREGAKENLNVEGAYLEVVADAVGSVGAIVAGVLLLTFGWTWVDPVVGAAIGLWILPRTYRLGRRAVGILLQSAPDGFDVDSLERELGALPGVVDVHDLHVWTLTSEMDAASAHLMTTTDADAHQVLDRARTLLQERFAIDHATFQVEPETHVGCTEVAW